jgi:hypothetical protein
VDRKRDEDRSIIPLFPAGATGPQGGTAENYVDAQRQPPTAENQETGELTPEEAKERRVRKEAERLAGLAESDWRYQVPLSAKNLDVTQTVLQGMVVALLKERKAQADIEKAEDQRREKERLAAQKQKEKAFGELSKLPRAEEAEGIAELATRFGEDPEALRKELEAISTPAKPAAWAVTPWDEPVVVAALLQELSDQISKYIVMDEHYLVVTVLWTAMAWVHNEVAAHSPILDVTSTDEGQGKTELLGVLRWLTPKAHFGSELTGPTLFRTVDADKPTLIMDDCDDLFHRKPDLLHITNDSWTRDVKIPRLEKIDGQYRTVWFDPFCPKILGRVLLVGKGLPRTLASRCISIKLWPKLPDEKVENFRHCDDDDFATLRRKLLRFANDQAKAIAEIKPTFPDIHNRFRENYRLLLAIAELAGGEWPDCARKGVELIAGKTAGSQGTRLFTAFHALCVVKLKAGATEIVVPSEDAVALLHAFDSYWENDYRGSDGHPGEITKSKLAALLAHYEIYPETVHPEKRETNSPRGYVILKKGEWREPWLDRFGRFCPRLPHIRTFENPKGKKPKGK